MTELQNGLSENHASAPQLNHEQLDNPDHGTSIAHSNADSSHPSTLDLTNPQQISSNGDDFEEGPPPKRRKTADTTTCQTPPAKPKPPSPPWKRFAAEGPATFSEDGKRKSARTNPVPLELQPSGDKRQTRAALHQVVKGPKSRYGGAVDKDTGSTNSHAHHTQINGKYSHSPSKTTTPLRPGSAHKNAMSNTSRTTPNSASLPTAKRPYKKRASAATAPSSAVAPASTNPHQTRGAGRSRKKYQQDTTPSSSSTEASEQSDEESEDEEDREVSDEDEEDDGESSPKAVMANGSTHKPQRLNLRVKPPSVKIQHPDQVLPPRRFPSFKEWFETEGSRDSETPYRKSQAKIQEEADLRRTILKEARPGGLLSQEKSTVYAPESQEEPSRQYAHNDHLVTHMAFFHKLLRIERERHRKNARICAYAAADFWKARQPKTEEEIQQEMAASYRATYQQVWKDLQHKWNNVTQEVQRRKLQEWEEQQQALGKQALNRVLEQSKHLLEKRRRGESSGADGSESEGSANDHHLASEEAEPVASENESNVSSSEADSDPGSKTGVDDDDEGLTQEELIRKYAKVTAPSSLPSLIPKDEDAQIKKSNASASPIDRLDEREGDVTQSLASQSPPQAIPVDVNQVDDALMTDSDKSIDMDDDDMEDTDGQGSTGSENESDDASDASSAKTGLVAFFGKVNPLVRKESSDIPSGRPADTENGAEEEKRHSPDAAQVQTPSASNGEEPSLETLKKANMPRSGEPSALEELMNIKSASPLQDGSLPTTPVSANLVKTAVPSLLRGTLREYQHFGLDWLAGLYGNKTNGILADEMGLGKTIQTISLLAHLAVHHEVWGPHLIVVPTSVMLNWEMEFKKFLPGFKVLTYYGTQEERKQKRQGWHTDADKWNVWITSYQLALKDDQVFKRRHWHYMVLDEAHNIKNFRSKRWQTLLHFNTRARLLLTGTPLQNNLTELWSLLYFIMPQDNSESGPGQFTDLENWTKWFRTPVQQIIEQGRDAMDDEARANVAKLHKLLRPFLLRRLKADVEKQMPGKYEHVVYCRLSKRQRYLYDGFMSRAQTRETLAGGNYLSIINCLMQLRKVCNHPDLFETRQIVTSFAMPKPVVADYEIKELLIRRRLLNEGLMGSVDLNVINLLPGDNEPLSALDTIQKQRLGALGALRQLTGQQWNRLNPPETLDGTSSASVLAHMENAARRARFEALRHAAYLTSLRSQRRPLYSNSLMERLRFNKRTVLSDTPRLRRQELADWWTNLSPALAAMVPTISQRSQALETAVEKFACVTPAAIACNLAPVALCKSGVQAVRAAQSSYPEDPFHEARMRLSIAFPDKRLLQYDCGKLQRLDSLLRTLQAGNHRALIFTQMTKVLDILEQFLNIHGHRYLRLDGQTKIEQRQILTERFNNDPRILVFILSSRSGGLGINLTGADSVIFYDLDWNPAMDKQCQDRCHRIGQTRDVHIYRFVSEHTIEANILRKANQKRMLDDVVIQEGEFTTDYFNKAGVKEMFDDGGYSGDAEADAAMDRVLGGRMAGKVFEQAEDQEDIAAARNAEKELVQTDAADFDDKANPSSGGGATPKTPGPTTPGELMPPPSKASKPIEHSTTLEAAESGLAPVGAQNEEEEEEDDDGGHIDEYMLRLVEWELRDIQIQPVVDKSKKKSKKAGEHGVRKR
ncbi:MAG: hypothetical protein Q9174_002535 [Haloplaca sp. 1 TL-2023]